MKLEIAAEIVAVVLGGVAPCSAQSFPEQVRGHAIAVDGDTIEIDRRRIRLNGIDAPESSQTCNGPRGGTWKCGTDATTMLSDLIGDDVVTCNRTAADDTFGRLIAVCRTSKRNLNAEMVVRGMAWSYREYSNDFNVCEEDAKKRHVGIWRVAQTQPPWEFRHDAWAEALEKSPRGRPIKGNFRAKGGCIYHTPWSRHYRRLTNMNPPNKWFADEADALAAGCRHAKGSSPVRRKRKVASIHSASSACPIN